MSLLLPHHPITANGDLPSREMVELFQRLERSIPALSGLTVANFDAAAINTSGEGLSDSDTELPTTAAVTDALAGSVATGLVGPTATTSGTEVDFSIPAGAKRVDVLFDGVSLSGTDEFLVQLGDSGGIETTGYTSTSSNTGVTPTDTTGFVILGVAATDAMIGTMSMTLADGSNLWVETHVATRGTGANVPIYGGGRKALSGELTTVRVTRTGTNTFDSGAVSVRWWT